MLVKVESCIKCYLPLFLNEKPFVIRKWYFKKFFVVQLKTTKLFKIVT